MSHQKSLFKRRKQQRTQRRARWRRLVAEPLEDRRMLAAFTEGNIVYTLSSFQTDDLLIEYAPDGTEVQRHVIPGSEGFSRKLVKDVVVDSLGRAQLFDGYDSARLTTYHPGANAFSETNVPAWDMGRTSSAWGDIDTLGEFIFANEQLDNSGTQDGIIRFNTADLSFQRFAQSYTPVDLTVGLDGNLYTLESQGVFATRVHVYDPQSMQEVRSFDVAEGVASIAVDAAGNLYGTTSTGLKHFDPNGNVVNSTLNGGLADDINIGPGGALLLSNLTSVTITNTDFSSFFTFQTPGNVQQYVTGFATFVGRAVPNILVSVTNDHLLREYDQTGFLVSEAAIPYGSGQAPTTELLRDIVVDPDNEIQIYNGTFAPFLTSFDRSDSSFVHATKDGWSTANVTSYGGIGSFEQYVFATDTNTNGAAEKGIVRFNTDDSTSVRFADSYEFQDLTIGLNGLLYAMDTSFPEDVQVYDPVSLAKLRTIDLPGLNRDYRGIAVNACGEIFANEWSGIVYHLDGDGNELNSLDTNPLPHQIPPGLNNLNDIDVAADGRIAVGTRFGDVILTNEALTDPFLFLVEELTPVFVAFDEYRVSPQQCGGASIHGVKFEDLNGNGQRDAGEPGVPGVTISVSGAATASATTMDDDPNTPTVDEAGMYWIDGLSPGGYTVAETVPPGWEASTPPSVNVGTLISGDAVFVDFGNTVPGSIHGFKFDDVDGDGQYDPNVDHPLAGVVFQVTGVTGQGAAVDVLTDPTNSQGEFWQTGLLPGDYTVTEIVPDGYLATTSTTFQATINSREEYVWRDGAAMLPQGDPRREVNVGVALMFGNELQTPGSIHGVKYHDLDHDGTRDVSEPGLAGWTIKLDGTDATGGSVSVTTTTMADDPATPEDETGMYWISDLLPGTYTVGEVTELGWTQTEPGAPGAYVVSLGSGETVRGVDFGNYFTCLAFDFNGIGNINATGYTPVVAGPGNQYTAALGYGWDSTAPTFTRGGPDSLLRDGHYGSNNVFKVDVANGSYTVNVVVGDKSFARNKIDVYAEGTLKLDDLATPAGQFLHRTLTTTVTDGTLDLRFKNDGGDPFFTVNAIKIWTVVADHGLTTADGMTVTGSNATPGALVTVSTSNGAIISADMSSSYVGTQVWADSGGNFTFTVNAPLSGSANFSSAEVDGAGNGSTSFAYTVTPVFDRYDFNKTTPSVPVTETGFTPVLPSDIFSFGTGYGWRTSPIGAFQRGTSGYLVTSVALYRDGAYGGSGAGGERTFQVAVGGGTFDVQVYAGDRGVARNNIYVKLEGVAGSMPVPNTAANVFTSVVLMGGSDVNSDGKLDITFGDSGGDPFWTINGVDVAPAGSLPGIAPLFAAEATSGDVRADSLSPRQLDLARSAALAIWQSQGVSDQQLAQLQSVPVSIRDMDSHGYLGLSYFGGILIDDNGAGAGWHTQIATAPAAGQMDLLTTVVHEFGHQLGLDDLHDEAGDLMHARLSLGERRLGGLPTAALAQANLRFASDARDSAFALWAAGEELQRMPLGDRPGDSQLAVRADDFTIDVLAERRRREGLALHTVFAELADEEHDLDAS